MELRGTTRQVLLVAFAVCLVHSAGGDLAEIRLTVRNLSGRTIKLFWREPRDKADGSRRLVPQSKMALRNTLQTTINTFRGHEFIGRPTDAFEMYSEESWREGEVKEEVYFIVGTTNDVVIIGPDFAATHRNAKFEASQIVGAVVDECQGALEESAECAQRMLANGLSKLQGVYVLERGLREGMYEDLKTYGAPENETSPEPPRVPPNGWPAYSEFGSLAAEAVTACGGTVPPLHLEESCSATPLAIGSCSASLGTRPFYATPKERNSARDCAVWARIGECDKNPNYMLTVCKIACDWEKATGQPVGSTNTVITMVRAQRSFEDCLVDRLEPLVEQLLIAVSNERNAKTSVSVVLRDAMCATGTATSTPIATEQWEGNEGWVHDIDVFLNLSTATIRRVQNFVTAEECELMMNNTRERLKPATVNEELAGKGLNSVSKGRRAQSGIVDTNYSDPLDPMGRIQRRALKLTNDMLGYGLTHEGQEPLQVIQYDKPENHGGETQEYRNHCDGICDGSPFQSGGRISTTLIYCEVADEGGGTTFVHSRVFVTPKKLDAVFFTYKDPDSDNMDFSLTEHSGCPVLQGEKWVVTQWLRQGVTQDFGWTRYDPSGGLALR